MGADVDVGKGDGGDSCDTKRNAIDTKDMILFSKDMIFFQKI